MSALSVDLEQGSLTVRDVARKPLVSIALAKGQLQAPAGQPVSMTLDGTIDATPVAMRIGTGAVRDLVRPGSQVPVPFNAGAAAFAALFVLLIRRWAPIPPRSWRPPFSSDRSTERARRAGR